jgi:hypothetical protein
LYFAKSPIKSYVLDEAIIVKLSTEPQNWKFNDTSTNHYEKLINVTAKVDQSLEMGFAISRDEFNDNFEALSLKIQAEVYIFNKENKSVWIIDEKGKTLKG